MTKKKTRRVLAPATRSAASAAPKASIRRAEPFADTLLRHQQAAGLRRKGERTRDRLKLAAVQILEERGFLRTRVSDICKRADVSAAAFYLYFKNKEDITVEVLTEFLHEMFKLSAAPDSNRSQFEAIYQSNLLWIASVRANAGLMHCLLQLGDQVPKFRALNENLNHKWFLHVTERLLKRFPKVRVDRNAVLLAVYALGGMMDDLSRKMVISREGHLQAVIDATTPTDEAVVEFVSLLWYRALFGTEPPHVDQPASRELQKLRAVDSAALPER